MNRYGITRRQFLGRSAAAATAAAVGPNILSRTARAAANERITLGFIGIGNMGSGLLGSFVGMDDTQVLAISEVKDDVGAEGVRRVEEVYAEAMEQGSYTGCDLYRDFQDLLARDDIDAVVIATPDHWHGVMTVLAARAGKDIYCEKPLSFDVGDAQAMRAAVRRYGVVLQTGSQQRSGSNFRFACELVRNGYIGRVKEVYADVGGTSHWAYFDEEPIPDGVDWDRWLGPSPWYPYNSERISGDYSGGWRLIRDTSGGMITDWGAHHFDIAQWGLGMDGRNPVEIQPPSKSESGYLTYVYENGVTLQKRSCNGARFIGEEGEVEVNRNFLRTDPESLEDIDLAPGDIRLYDSPNHYRDWLNCIRSRQRPIADVEIGASSVITCHLGNIAKWTNRVIRWDPDAEQILDDEEASRWLNRPKREPWAWI